MNAIWELDVLQLRGRTAFINGWLFLPDQPPLERLVLQLRDSGRQVVGTIVLSHSHNRPDVELVHRQYASALNSGFVGLGSWPRAPRHGDQLVLQGSSNGSSFSLIIDPHRWHGGSQPSRWQRRKAELRLWLGYAKRALRLLARGQIKLLQEKLRRQLQDAPQRPLPIAGEGQELQLFGGTQTPPATIHLVVDHRLGGGANQYRQHLVQQWLNQGHGVLTLTYHLASLQPMLVVDDQHHQHRYALADFEELTERLHKLNITSITYNTAVSFAGAERIPALLLKLKEQHQASLRVLVHDYFIVCPSHFLLNSQEQFCGIPDLDTCRACLPNNANGFTSLFHGDIKLWRQTWGPLLSNADAVVCFSKTSIELLKQAYETWPDGQSWLSGKQLSLKPHSLNDFPSRPVRITTAQRPIIGVVGQIGRHKGGQLLRDIASAIKQQQTEERIVIIGTLEGSFDHSIIRETGPYKRDQLAEEIEKSGANIMLFPSIWPETFSFVTEELMQLNLPLACLDLGAPAERVSQYSKGLVLGSHDPNTILQELRQFFHKLYQPST